MRTATDDDATESARIARGAAAYVAALEDASRCLTVADVAAELCRSEAVVLGFCLPERANRLPVRQYGPGGAKLFAASALVAWMDEGGFPVSENLRARARKEGT